MLVLMRSFSYTPDASFSEVFLTNLMPGLAGSFSDTLDASFIGEFLIHSSCWFSLIRDLS